MTEDASSRDAQPEAADERDEASEEPETSRAAEATDTGESVPETVESVPDSDADDGVEAESEVHADAAAGATVEVSTSPAAEEESGVDAEEESAAYADESDNSDADAGADADSDAGDDASDSADEQPMPGVPEDVRTYDRFKKMDGAQYERVNEFLRARTYITAREWAMARLCADFRTETGVEMTKIGENLPELVPFMTDTYTPQAVNQARASFEEKVRKAGATFLYGAMSDFLTADELDDLMYEVTEVAKFLLEVEGVDLAVEEELDSEERISSVMREVRRSSDALRHDGMECPNCGHEIHTEE